MTHIHCSHQPHTCTHTSTHSRNGSSHMVTHCQSQTEFMCSFEGATEKNILPFTNISRYIYKYTHTHTFTTQQESVSLIQECTLLKPLNTLWSLHKQRQLLSYSLPLSLTDTHTHTHRKQTWVSERHCIKATCQRKQSMKYSAKVLFPHLTQS